MWATYVRKGSPLPIVPPREKSARTLSCVPGAVRSARDDPTTEMTRPTPALARKRSVLARTYDDSAVFADV